jgi:plasmid maintenance system antidote protein VapI
LSTFRSDAHPGDFLNEQLLQLYGIYYFKEEHLEVGGMPNSII